MMVSDDGARLTVSLTLDPEGFLRRECPTCDREFKWLPSTDDGRGGESAPDGGYYCPYCGIQAQPNSWFTQAQLQLAHNTVATEVVAPMLEDFGRNLERIGRSSTVSIHASVRYDGPEKLDPLTESDDMVRIDFDCHPAEPVKVLDNWQNSVHCLICGREASA